MLYMLLRYYCFPCSQVRYKFNNDFFSLASRRPHAHSCYLESAATHLVKKVDCPELRRMIQRWYLKRNVYSLKEKKMVKVNYP
jgi:hypothetical protein